MAGTASTCRRELSKRWNQLPEPARSVQFVPGTRGIVFDFAACSERERRVARAPCQWPGPRSCGPVTCSLLHVGINFWQLETLEIQETTLLPHSCVACRYSAGVTRRYSGTNTGYNVHWQLCSPTSVQVGTPTTVVFAPRLESQGNSAYPGPGRNSSSYMIHTARLRIASSWDPGSAPNRVVFAPLRLS
eukprot:3519831-Rhodomonas_salina.1